MIELPCQINDDYFKKLKQIETVKDRLQYDIYLLKHYNKELEILEKKREAYQLSLERDF